MAMAIYHLAAGIVLLFVAHHVSAASEPYANVTLHSPIMSARVFLPYKDESEDSQYYVGSRFEHGSMIGDVVYGHKTVYGREMWRTPHDASWPESGVGLASEFGCGDDGPTCAGKGDITNGVLGYESAKNGEPFLKIGVGALIKGSCPDCLTDPTDDYKFNSPYKFYRQPKWSTLPSPSPNEVSFLHEESLGDLGYRIQKTIRLEGNIMTVRTILSNSGKKQFSTPWYSHHFFTGDNDPVGPGYGIDLGLSEYGVRASAPLFDQPGIGLGWAEDLNTYANVTMARDGSISMRMSKTIPEGVRLKAEFLDEQTITLTDGSFTLHAPNGLSVEERIPELQSQSRNPFIYKYNVYAERGTLSPEPMLLLYLQPAETTVWTQHLKFTSPVDARFLGAPFLSLYLPSDWQNPSFMYWRSALAVALCSAAFAGFYSMFIGTRRVDAYAPIPDAAVDVV